MGMPMIEDAIYRGDYSFIPYEFAEQLVRGEVEFYTLEVTVNLWTNDKGELCPETKIKHKTLSFPHEKDEDEKQP